jgi:hypothetical protein
MAYTTNLGSTYPLYLPRKITTTIPGSSLSTPTSFISTRGYVTLVFVDSATGYTFSFALSGGYGSPSIVPNANSVLFAIPSTAAGCTVTPQTYTPNISTTVNVTTPSGDSGGRSYGLTFYLPASLRPTIEQISGSTPSSNLLVSSNDFTNALF